MKNLFEKVLGKNLSGRILSVTAVMLITSSFFFTGCGIRTPEVNTIQLQNEAGDFQYADVSWGMDKNSVEAAMGITFDQGALSSSSGASGAQTYIAKDAYTMMGLPATVFCEFDTSGLYSIRFRISPADKDVQTCWDTMTSALLTKYGSIDPTCLNYDSPVRLESEIYLWEHSDTIHTALCAQKTSMGGKTPMIEFTVYVIPPDRTQ